MSEPGAASSLSRVVRPLLQRWGGAFMTSSELAEVERAAGLDKHALYFRGRSAVLGDPPPGVVAELFGIFPGWLLEVTLPTATATVDSARAVAAYQEGAGRWARGHLARFSGSDELAEFLRRLVHGADASGLALFAGWQQAPWPDEPLAAVGHGLAVLREYRGGVHFAALRAVGLTVPEAVVADPEGGRARMLRTAWRPEEADEVIARAKEKVDLSQRWARAEALTDDRMDELLTSTLSGVERDRFVAGLREVDTVAR